MNKELHYLDKNGNEMINYRGLWWSANFDRFWQLLILRNAPPLLTCTSDNGKIRYLTLKDGRPNRTSWWKKWHINKMMFIDPASQEVYPRVRYIDERMENIYREPQSVSES